MIAGVHESTVESAALAYFAELGYAVAHGPDLAPDSVHPERSSYADVVLTGRLRAATARINPQIPAEAREEAVRRVLHPDSPSLHSTNQQFHRQLAEGVPVEYRAPDGRVIHDTLRLADFAKPAVNDWLVVNQFTIVAAHAGRQAAQRRPDIVVFLNGLPLGLIELKNPADENATVQGAFRQLQTYQRDLPALFPYNEVLVVSDGMTARIGTLTSDWERFMPWRTIEGDDLAPKGTPELEVLVKGVFEQRPSWTCCGTSSSTRPTDPSSRRSRRATTSITPSTRQSPPPCRRPALPATGGPASSGTPRAAARASP